MTEVSALFTLFASGLALGLASALHCSCMCGGIASGALFLLQPKTRAARLTQLMLLQSGRVALYALAGAAIAGISTVALAPSLTATSFRALQWIAAIALMWFGLSTAGMLPRLALPGGASSASFSFLRPMLSAVQSRPVAGPLVLGMSWGLTPCPMVYAALFTAALTGAPAYGALWMLGFGLGTVPGVVAATLGVSALSRLRRGPLAEAAAGMAIAAFGFSTLYFGWPQSALLCAPA